MRAVDVDKSELDELVSEIVGDVDERGVSLPSKILEVALQLLELLDLKDDRVADAIDLLTEAGVELTMREEEEASGE